MHKRMLITMLMLICSCGCQSSDPYVRRSELLTKSKQIAQAQAGIAITTLDRKTNTAIKELSSAIKHNAESISSLESTFDTVAKQNAESISELKSSLELGTRQNNTLIQQNTASISNLESTLNAFVEQNTQSTANFRTDLEQLEKQLSQFRLGVRQEFSKQEADRSETTDQLAERIDQLVERVGQLNDDLERAFLLLTECQESKDASSTRNRASEEVPIDGESGNQTKYSAPLPIEEQELAYMRPSSYQLSSAALGLIVIVSGPIVAELYAVKHKKLAESLTRRPARRT
jgi:uncharacterized phage infection (PIP) family protein YhgE